MATRLITDNMRKCYEHGFFRKDHICVYSLRFDFFYLSTVSEVIIFKVVLTSLSADDFAFFYLYLSFLMTSSLRKK